MLDITARSDPVAAILPFMLIRGVYIGSVRADKETARRWEAEDACADSLELL